MTRSYQERLDLFENNKMLAYQLLNKYYLSFFHGKSNKLEDLEQAALLALWNATGTWDKSKGPLSTHLKFLLMNEVRDVLRHFKGVSLTKHEYDRLKVRSLDVAYYSPEMFESLLPYSTENSKDTENSIFLDKVKSINLNDNHKKILDCILRDEDLSTLGSRKVKAYDNERKKERMKTASVMYMRKKSMIKKIRRELNIKVAA